MVTSCSVYVRTLLPVAEVEVTAREPVVVSTGIAREILGQVRAMRLMEGGSGHWMGVGYEETLVGGGCRPQRVEQLLAAGR